MVNLQLLKQAVLGYEVRKEGAPHNCLDDARAAMKLVLAQIEHGVDNAFPLVQELVGLDLHVNCCTILMVIASVVLL